jgi:hypothetical protein
LGILICATLCAPVLAEEQPAWSKKNDQWFESVPPGSTLRVNNPFGNIHARFGGYQGRLELLATSQRIDHDQPALVVRRLSHDRGLDVTVEAEGEIAEGKPYRDRVDLVVFVPLGIRLEAQTLDDLIEIKGVKSDASVTTLTGDVRVRSVVGSVEVTTDRGNVSVALSSDVTERPQSVSSKTGSIEVYISEDADMDVSIETSGDITTDFSLAIEHRRLEEPDKHATARIGDGGDKLSLISKRGSVRLMRLPADPARD